MGASASVSIHPSRINDKHFKDLLLSKELRNELFKEISSSSVDGHINLKNKISLKKIVAFYTNKSHPLYQDFVVNVIVLTEAFKQTAKHKKGEQLSKRDFHLFLPTLFLFTKLFDVFTEADKTVVPDDKVFKGEFIKAKRLIAALDGVTMLEISDEEWEQEFYKLDKSKDGHISFSEFCSYAVKHIIKPSDFVDEFIDQEDDDPEDAPVDAPVEAVPVDEDMLLEEPAGQAPNEVEAVLQPVAVDSTAAVGIAETVTAVTTAEAAEWSD